jgi:hypothetical protein
MIYCTEATVSPPLHALAGDLLERNGAQLKLIRNGQVVATATIGQQESIDSGEIISPRTISSIFLTREVHMPTTAKVASVVYEAPPATDVYVNYSDGNQQPFASRQALLDYVAAKEAQLDQWAKDALLIAWVHRSANADNPAWINGKTLQIDLSLDLNQLSIGVVE